MIVNASVDAKVVLHLANERLCYLHSKLESAKADDRFPPVALSTLISKKAYVADIVEFAEFAMMNSGTMQIDLEMYSALKKNKD